MDQQLDPTLSKIRSGPLAKLLTRLNELRRAAMVVTPSQALTTTTPNRALASRPQPATEAEIITHLTMLDVCFPSQRMTQADRSLRFRVFCSDLQGFPEPVVAAACRRYRCDKGSKGFPFVGELLALCGDEMRGLRVKLNPPQPVPQEYPPHPQPLKLIAHYPTLEQEPEPPRMAGVWTEIDRQREMTPEQEREYLERVRAIHGPRNEYHETELAKEIERHNGRNAWLSALHDSLPI